jgi:Leucine rich repeat
MALSEACILQSTSYWDHCILSGETDAKREGRLERVVSASAPGAQGSVVSPRRSPLSPLLPHQHDSPRVFPESIGLFCSPTPSQASVSPRVLCSPHNNQLTALPESFDNLTNLQELYAKNNRLISLPTSLGNMARLKEICVSDNQLTALPDSLGNLTRLMCLDLRNNRLTALPEPLGNLTRLTFLDLRANTLVSLPAAIGGLPNLEKVGARWNKLSSLPKWFQRASAAGMYCVHRATGNGNKFP